MGIFITDAIPHRVRVRLGALALVSIGLLLSAGGAMIPAAADNGPLYVAPGPGRVENWATSLAARLNRPPAAQPIWS
jgi:hypothetical protein